MRRLSEYVKLTVKGLPAAYSLKRQARWFAFVSTAGLECLVVGEVDCLLHQQFGN